jgi:hypothetical protein
MLCTLLALLATRGGGVACFDRIRAVTEDAELNGEHHHAMVSNLALQK